eukprot:974037-Pelagomonas_calceolata.AAC.2
MEMNSDWILQEAITFVCFYQPILELDSAFCEYGKRKNRAGWPLDRGTDPLSSSHVDWEGTMEAPSALFQQYEADYCQKSTSVSKKLPTLEGLAGGASIMRDKEPVGSRECE